MSKCRGRRWKAVQGGEGREVLAVKGRLDLQQQERREKKKKKEEEKSGLAVD